MTTEETSNTSDDVVPVCGVGASAGGVEPLVDLIANFPVDCEFAIVVIQHLSPDHESMMSTLLQRRTSMPVRQVVDHDVLEPGHVYVLGPGDEVMLANGHLKVKDRPVLLEGSRSPHPIDLFFKSLASRGSKACAIVLSGTGSDGADGVKAVRQSGGLTLAQDDSALFADMPRAALDSGFLDAVGDAPELAQFTVSFMAGGERPSVVSQFEPMEIEVLAELEASTGINFEDYKRGTIHRRLEQEVQRLGLESLEDLARRLRTSPADSSEVARQLLIGVTTFFRNPMAFDQLAEEAADALVTEAANEGRAVRVWIAGCATGQEAYSVAMILLEARERLGLMVPVKVFATDIHDGFLAVAREGVYSEEQMNEVNPERRAEFFTAAADGWRVTPELRGTVAFSQHNILSDAPFTRIDLMVCRNTLIYFTRNAQMNAMWAFGFALRKGGVLMLGESEMLGVAGSDFAEISPPGCLFRKVDNHVTAGLRRSRGPLDIRLAPPKLPRSINLTSSRPGNIGRVPPPMQMMTLEAHELIAKQLGLGGLVFNETRELTRIIGRGAEWLRFTAGPAPSDGVALIEDPILRGGVESILHQLGKGESDPAQPVTLASGGERELLLLRGSQVANGPTFHTLVYAVPPSLQNDDVVLTEPRLADSDVPLAERVEWLEKELAMAREQLHSTLEQRDSSVADLAATNEELVVSNEELQTSIEELSSVNEELRTMADENEARLTEVLELGSDLEQILDAIDIGIILLNTDLTIRRYSEPATRYFHIVRTDIGRPFSHIRPDFEISGLADAVTRAIQTKEASSLRTSTEDDDSRTLLINVRPYHIARGELGCSITAADITTAQLREELEKVTERMTDTLAVTGVAVWERSHDMEYRWGSDNFAEVVGFSVDDWRSFPNIEAIHPDDRIMLAELMAEQRREAEEGLTPELSFDYRVLGENGQYRVVNAKTVAAINDDRGLVWGVTRDVTERRQQGIRLEELNEELARVSHRLERTLAATGVVVWERSADRSRRWASSNFADVVGFTVEDWKNFPNIDVIHPDDRVEVERQIAAQRRELAGGRTTIDIDYRVLSESGEYRVVNDSIVVDSEDGQSVLLGVSSDVTAERHREQRLIELTDELIGVNQQLVDANDQLTEFVHVANRDLRQPLVRIESEVNRVLSDERVASLEPDDSCSVLLHTVRNRTQALSEMLEEFLGYATVGDSGPYVPDDVDLSQMGELVVAQVEPAPGTVIDLRADVATVCVERVPFRACLRNLIATTARHAGVVGGGLRVDINRGKASEGPGQIEVRLAELGGVESGTGAVKVVEERLASESDIEMQIVQRILGAYGSQLDFAIDEDGRATVGFDWPLTDQS